MTEEIINKTYKSVGYRTIFQILQQISAFILSVILARLLTPTEFGIIALANLVIQYANNFTNLGFNNGLIQQKKITLVHINSVFTADLSISSLLFFFTYFGSGFISHYFNNPELVPVLKWMSIYYIITTFYYLPVVILRREIDYKFISINEYIKTLTSYILTIILALNGFSYWSIIYSTLAVTALWALIFVIKAKWIPKIQYNHKAMKELYSFGAWNFIRSQLILLVSKFDYFIIGKYLNAHFLGLYEKSFELMDRSISGISAPLNGVFFSSFSRLQEEKDVQKKIFYDALKILSTLIFPLVFGMLAIADRFVIALLGKEWIDAILTIRLLAFAMIFRITSGVIASLNVANSEYRQQTYFEIISTIIFIISCFFLIKFGINGVAVAVIIFSVISFFLGLRLVISNSEIKITEIFVSIKLQLIASILMFLIVFSISRFTLTDVQSIVHFGALVLIGALIYIIFIYLFIKLHLLNLNFDIKSLKLKNV